MFPMTFVEVLGETMDERNFVIKRFATEKEAEAYVEYCGGFTYLPDGQIVSLYVHNPLSQIAVA